MNIANSKALLLGLVLCLFALSSSAASIVDGGEKKAAKKDIIIVNIDTNLNSQLSGLAQYTYDLYLSTNKGIVTIKKYLKDASAEEQSIDELVVLIKDLGISAANITVEEEILKLDNPYFTLSVSAGPEVQ